MNDEHVSSVPVWPHQVSQGSGRRVRQVLTFWAAKADAEELHFLGLVAEVHGGPHPRLVAAGVLLQLGAGHHCEERRGN